MLDGRAVAARHGTVGAVARDAGGRVAAATSTGGMIGQADGRVGDSPIVGAGVYARDNVVAISCTGRRRGLHPRRRSATTLPPGSATPARASPRRSGRPSQQELAQRGSTGGLVAVGGDGRIVVAHNSPAMFSARGTGPGARADDMTDTPAEELPLRDEIFQRMDELTPAERKVARTLLARYPAAGLESTAALAAAAGTSKPTVLRLLARLGFGSYPDFQQRLRAEVTRSMSGSPLSRARSRQAVPSDDSVFLRAVEQRARLVTRLQDTVPPGEIDRAVHCWPDARSTSSSAADTSPG